MLWLPTIVDGHRINAEVGNKRRNEQGSLKAFPSVALTEAVKLRFAQPELSTDSLIDILRSQNISGAEQMCVSTFNCHFRRLGKDRPALKRIIKKRYRLLSVEGARVLWIGDVWVGPYLHDDVKEPEATSRRHPR